jgi:serine/threonine-protein kinase PpkA
MTDSIPHFHIARRHVLAMAVAASAMPVQVLGKPRTPLLMDGKKTLFQRILTRPGAALVSTPGDSGGKPVEPFSAFFVYERKDHGGKPWLLVGGGSGGKTEGYLAEGDTVPWRHAITLSFATPGNRERVLFFRERAGLMNFVDADNVATESQRYAKEIAAKGGSLGPSSPVIAAEPEKYVDLKKQFYLLPVLEASSTLLKTGHRVRTVKVASVTRDSAAPTAAPAADGNAGIANFNAAVVFVIDATSSMQPYIDRTRKALEEVLRQAESARVLNRIRFGLVAFQDDPTKTKGVEYLSKVFVDPA